MKALVYGARGLVGQHLMKELGPDGIASKLDIRDGDRVKEELQHARPDVVYLAAAMTDVDACQRDPQKSWFVNVMGPVEIVRAWPNRIVFFSTDYVFDGDRGPYSEHGIPNPLSVYGQHKLMAEHYILAHAKDPLIIRTTQIYGSDLRQRNFVYSVLSALRAKKPFRAAVDQLGTPTYAPRLAKIAVNTAGRGVVNVVDGPWMSRHTWALMIADVWGLNDTIEAVCTEELQQAAPRPSHGGLRVCDAWRSDTFENLKHMRSSE